MLGRLKNRRKGLIFRSISLVVLLGTIGLILNSAPITLASDVTITFEESIPVPGNVKTQYCNNPATNQGVEFKLAASRFEPSVATFSGTHALRDNPSGDDVAPLRGPMIFSFTTGQSHVGVRVGLDESHDFPVRAVLRAFDDPDPDEGTKLTPSPDPSVMLGTGPAAITTPLAFSTPTGEPTIRRVEIEFLGPIGQGAQEIIDDLTFGEIGPSCLTDTEAPTVQIFEPTLGQIINNPQVLLHFRAQDDISGIASIRVLGLDSGGFELTSFFSCGGGAFPDSCPSFPSSLDVESQFWTVLPDGATTIRVEATDFAGNTGQAEVSPTVTLPDPNYNLWALGIELTQGIQNQVAASSMSRSSFAAEGVVGNFPIPLIAGKRTVVRLYPGIEGTNTPVAGVRATLECKTVLGGQPGSGEPCDGPTGADLLDAEITVDPANNNELSKLRLNANLSWNFILPPEWTEPGERRFLIAHIRAPANLPECGSFFSGCADGANFFVLEVGGFQERAPLVIQPIFACIRRDPNVPQEQCDAVASNANDAQNVAMSFFLGRDWDNDGTLDPYLNTTFPVADGIEGIQLFPPILNDYTDGDLSTPTGILNQSSMEAYLDQLCLRRLFDSASGMPPETLYVSLVGPPTGPSGLAPLGEPCAIAKVDLDPGRIGDGVNARENDFCSNCSEDTRFTVHHDEKNIAHEIGHTFGIQHASCDHEEDQNNQSCDTAPTIFPCPHGGICLDINNQDEPFAFNTFNMGATPPRCGSPSSYPCLGVPVAGSPQWTVTHTHDFMSYGGESPTWISQHTFRTLFDGIGDSPRGETMGMALLVSGLIETDGTVTLNPLYELALALPEGDGQGDFSIELLDASDNVLAARNFTPSKIADGDSSHFFVRLPDTLDAVRLVIKRGDEILLERDRTPNDPSISILEPTSGVVWKTDDVQQTIRWDAEDVDGDQLDFTVQYSADEGNTWRTLANRWSETELEVDTSLLGGSEAERAMIRVLASDGFNTDIAESPLFSVEDKPPQLGILSPADGQEFQEGQMVNFIGAAIDPESGTLGNDAYIWESDLDGPIGQGHEIRTTTLSPGEHIITLIATDEDGMSVQASISVVVLEAPNTQPIADAGPDRQVIIGDEVQLNGGGSFDPDEDPLSFSWRFVSAPDGAVGPATLQSPTSDSPHFRARLAGIYIIELVVRDGEVDSIPDQVIVTFAPGVQCVNFVDVQTGVLSGSVFEKNGFMFGHLPPGDLLVDDFDPAGPGLLVGGDVLRIEWPASALMVNVTAGSWSGAPLNISAFDGAGNQVGPAMTVPPMDDVLTIGFNGKDIHVIEIVGGDNEGLLTEICIAPS
jgi:hypothetical protein